MKPWLQRVARETALRAALDELPDTWREVILARDALARNPASLSQRLALTPEQQRAILNRARASVRDRLAQRLRGGDDQ